MNLKIAEGQDLGNRALFPKRVDISIEYSYGKTMTQTAAKISAEIFLLFFSIFTYIFFKG
jgi:hypothetical protein